MIVVRRVVPVLLAVTILFLCTVTDSVTNNVLAAQKNRDQPHITFNSPDYSLEKVDVDVKQDKEGWSETAKWGAASGGDLVFVNIFAHVAYRKIIMSSHVHPADDRVHQITRGETVYLGGRGKAEIEPGFYEYQTYRMNEVPCVYIQSYWADRSFGGIDVVRGAKPSDKIVGNHMLQVVVCDQRKKEFSGKDVTEILASIGLRDAHWSKNWFVDDSEALEQKKDSKPISSLEEHSVDETELPQTGFTGIYDSEITGRIRKYITSENSKVELVQSGSTITGTYGDSEGEIWGKVVGNTVEFDWKSSINAGYGTGKWTFMPGASKVRGSWFNTALGSGDWNLVRQDRKQQYSTTKESSYRTISGSYRSEITSDTGYMFQHPRHRKLIINLEQDGTVITGTDQLVDSEINGTLEGDTIKFSFWSKKINSAIEVSGEWKVHENGRTLEGFWRFATSGGYGGKWNLTRIE